MNSIDTKQNLCSKLQYETIVLILLLCVTSCFSLFCLVSLLLVYFQLPICTVHYPWITQRATFTHPHTHTHTFNQNSRRWGSGCHKKIMKHSSKAKMQAWFPHSWTSALDYTLKGQRKSDVIILTSSDVLKGQFKWFCWRCKTQLSLKTQPMFSHM